MMDDSEGGLEECGLLDEAKQEAGIDPKGQKWSSAAVRQLAGPTSCVVLATFILVSILALPLLAYPRYQAHSSDRLSSGAGQVAIELHPENHTRRQPTTLTFNWTVSRGQRAPDGVEKQVYLVNGLFPGPTIEARSGDRVIVNVFNALDSEGVSIHWHGLKMRGHNNMDGAVGFTQCPIPPAKSFTYNFTIGDDEHGTFWWHSHSQVQRGDGLYGGLVVHRPAEVEPASPQTEALLMIGDWFHRRHTEVLSSYADYSSLGNEPVPDSLLINGHGRFNCSFAVPSRPVTCQVTKMDPILGRRERHPTRLRIVNVGTVAGFHFALHGASLKPAFVDGGCSVKSRPSKSVGILYPGERVDTIMTWDQDGVSRPRFSVYLDPENFLGFPNEALSPNQTFVALPEAAASSPIAIAPKLEVGSSHCALDGLKSTSQPKLTIEPKAQETIALYIKTQKLSRYENRPLGFINHTTWIPQEPPLLSLNRTMWNSNQMISFIGTTSRPSTVDLIINNLDDGSHPIHLHGNPFYILSSHRAQGRDSWGSYNPFDSEPLSAPNLKDPLVKDTVAVPRRGYVQLRFTADNPGLWMLHCHMLVHTGTGMAAGLHVGDSRDFDHSRGVDMSAAALCERDGKTIGRNTGLEFV